MRSGRPMAVAETTDLLDHRERARRHARTRAWERFGIALAEPDLKAIEAFVRAGGGRVVRFEKDGTKAVELEFREKGLWVLFKPALDCAVTVLPEGWAKRRGRPR